MLPLGPVDTEHMFGSSRGIFRIFCWHSRRAPVRFLAKRFKSVVHLAVNVSTPAWRQANKSEDAHRRPAPAWATAETHGRCENLRQGAGPAAADPSTPARCRPARDE